MSKLFKYKSICHSTMGVTMYSTKGLTVGETYDIYYADYPFSWEYEIFKDGVYYTSFILDRCDGETDKGFLKYFYNREQMIQRTREDSLNKIGI